MLMYLATFLVFALALRVTLEKTFDPEPSTSVKETYIFPDDGLTQVTTPLCSVWPDWRQERQTGQPVDDAALPKSRLGLPNIMGGPSPQKCMPASGRLGPFGHSSGKKLEIARDWSSLQWGKLQSDCAAARFGVNTTATSTVNRRLRRASPDVDRELQSPEEALHTGRTAVVLRVWSEYRYYDNQLAWMRALATELAVDTGGKYQLFILVDVKDQSLDLSDEAVYNKVLKERTPEEFRDASLLFDQKLLQEWFPKVGVYSAQDQMYQALQIFSLTFPEFDFVWQLEMDARFTGHAASMLTNSEDCAKSQPRKNMWERNARWYVSGLWAHYSDFAAQVDRDFSGRAQGIWGPHPYAEFFVEPRGPVTLDSSEESWGIGEDADLIGFSPMIDPVSTDWNYERTVHGFDPALALPRRMAIFRMTRTSRRLLRIIAAEQRATGSWVVSESTLETWSLLHGLKAIYVPHLIVFKFDDGEKSPQELDKMFNKGPSWSRAGGERAGFLRCGNEIGLPELRWRQASYFYWKGIAPTVWWDYTNATPPRQGRLEWSWYLGGVPKCGVSI